MHAQSFNFGFKGSYNVTYFHGDYIYTGDQVTLGLKQKLANRFSGGILLRYNVTSVFSIQSEVLYTTRGISFKENIDIGNLPLKLSGNLTLTYIEIPLLLRINTTLPDRGPTLVQEPGFTFNTYAGGSFGYKMNAKISGRLSGDIYGSDYNERFENVVSNQFTDTDVSFIIGAGFEYGIKYRFTFDLRYIISLIDIGNDPQFVGTIRNGMFAIFVGTRI
jgi:hypothetical protein